MCGDKSCVGDYACEEPVYYDQVRVGDKSCVGDYACEETSFYSESSVTISAYSCGGGGGGRVTRRWDSDPLSCCWPLPMQVLLDQQYSSRVRILL